MSTHEQALARIEEEISFWTQRDNEIDYLAYISENEIARIKSELSAWTTLKSVLELPEGDGYYVYADEAKACAWQEGRNSAIEELSDLIIKGVLGE